MQSCHCVVWKQYWPRSAYVSAQIDQEFLFHFYTLQCQMFLKVGSEDMDQAARMWKLIWALILRLFLNRVSVSIMTIVYTYLWQASFLRSWFWLCLYDQLLSNVIKL